LTPAAIDHGVHGQMLVTCVITTLGRVERCRVVKGLPQLDNEVVKSLEARRYRPAMRDGRPIEIDYNFKLYFAPVKWVSSSCAALQTLH
jgi:protein TonB